MTDKKTVDFHRVLDRLGAPDKPSLREVAGEMGVNESTLRSQLKVYGIEEIPARDNVLRRLAWLKDQIAHLGDIAAQLEADIAAEREHRQAAE